MRNLITGMFLGAIIGGMVGTVASDEIYDVKKKAMKVGKKFLKKYDMMQITRWRWSFTSSPSCFERIIFRSTQNVHPKGEQSVSDVKMILGGWRVF